MKMHHSLITATAVAFGLAAAMPAMAQTRTTETTTTTVTHTGPHRYVWYGDHDIYFAPTTKTYYWREGSEWRSGTELPMADRAYIKSGGITVNLDTERPYERNEWVVKHYSHHRDHDEDDNDHDHDD